MVMRLASSSAAAKKMEKTWRSVDVFKLFVSAPFTTMYSPYPSINITGRLSRSMVDISLGRAPAAAAPLRTLTSTTVAERNAEKALGCLSTRFAPLSQRALDRDARFA